jgi:hypothetical protein
MMASRAHKQTLNSQQSEGSMTKILIRLEDGMIQAIDGLPTDVAIECSIMPSTNTGARSHPKMRMEQLATSRSGTHPSDRSEAISGEQR